MISIRELGGNDFVHIPNRDDALKFTQLLYEMGYEWITTESFLDDIGWDKHEENTCYFFDYTRSTLSFARGSSYKEWKLEDLKEWVQHKNNNLMWFEQKSKKTSHKINKTESKFIWERTLILQKK